MSSKMIELVISVLAGGILGVFYFTGLWWTVRKLPLVRSPAILNLGSFLLRTAVVLSGFYLAMGGQWERLAACLGGFLGARLVLVRRFGPGRLKKG